MNISKLRTTVIGAGAIGGLIAVALVHAGHMVSVLARGQTLDAIRANGIRIIDGDHQIATQVIANDDTTELGIQDFVIIALKAQDLPAIAKNLRPLIGPKTVIISAMNGLPWWFFYGVCGALSGEHIEAIDPNGVISDSLPKTQSVGCVVYLSSSTDAPAIIRRGAGNHLIIGAIHPHLVERTKLLATSLKQGGFDITVSDDIRTAIWIKLWGNMHMNPLSVLTGSTADRLLDDSLTYTLALQMMEEASAIGVSLGLSTGMSSKDRMAYTRKLGAFRTSMLQDYEAGRSLEIEPILGVFSELGCRLNISTPFCNAILGLVRQRAMNGRS